MTSRLNKLLYLALAVSFLPACATTVRVARTTCVSDPQSSTCYGTLPDGTVNNVPFFKMDNYICMPPDQWRLMFEDSHRCE